MKVLFFVHTFPSVSETFVLNQVTGLIDKGHDVRVYAWGKPNECDHADYTKYNLKDITWYISNSIPHNKIKRVFHAINILFHGFLLSGSKIFKLLSTEYGKYSKSLILEYCAETPINRFKEWEPDVVITHFGDNGLIANSFKASGIIPPTTQCYIFFHAHEICSKSIKEIGEIYAPVFKSDDILLPISKFWERKLIDSGANTNRVHVFRMGVDVDRFDFRCNYGNDSNKVHILSVGRLVGQKGYEFSIQGVADYIKKTERKVRYTIIGTGPLESKLKNLVRTLDIEDNVEFLGAKSQEIVSEYMNKYDIFLLPSVTDEEGLMEGIPVALMEAMSRGLLCISTKHSGIPELIENNISGFLCEEKNGQEISSRLIEIEHLDPQIINQIKIKARKKIANEFNQKTLIDNLSIMISKQAE